MQFNIFSGRIISIWQEENVSDPKMNLDFLNPAFLTSDHLKGQKTHIDLRIKPNLPT